MENTALHNQNQWKDQAIQIQADQVEQMKKNVEELEDKLGNMDAEKEYWRISYIEESTCLNALKERKRPSEKVNPSSSSSPPSSSFSLSTPVRNPLSSPVMVKTDPNGMNSQTPGTSRPKKFEDAVEEWANWEHKDDDMDGIDLDQLLFSTDGKHVATQTVRKVPSLLFLFTAHNKMEKDREKLYAIWEKTKDDKKKDWERKGDILARWQRYQVKEGWIKTATVAEMKIMKKESKKSNSE